MAKRQTLDTSFVTEENYQYAKRCIAQEGYKGWVFAEIDDNLGYPRGTMASYFGKLSAQKRARKKALRQAKVGVQISLF